MNSVLSEVQQSWGRGSSIGTLKEEMGAMTGVMEPTVGEAERGWYLGRCLFGGGVLVHGEVVSGWGLRGVGMGVSCLGWGLLREGIGVSWKFKCVGFCDDALCETVLLLRAW